MYIFGIDLPLLELLVILSILVVIYLVVLEFEFRQMRRICKKMDEEELAFSRELREMRKTCAEMKSAVAAMGPARRKAPAPAAK